MDNNLKQRLARMIDYKNSYTGKSGVEKRARQNAVNRLIREIKIKKKK